MDDTTTENSSIILDLDRIECWNVFSRLQELAISCSCAPGQPLQVRVETPTIAAQVWSVIQQYTLPRQILAEHLERCWQQEVKQ